MRTIKVKPVESICIELTDKKYICTFNMLAVAHLQEAINKIDGKFTDIPTARMVSLILYSGIKANQPDFTEEEAVALAMQMDPSCHGEILNIYNEAMFNSLDEKQQSMLKKLLARYLSNAEK